LLRLWGPFEGSGAWRGMAVQLSASDLHSSGGSTHLGCVIDRPRVLAGGPGYWPGWKALSSVPAGGITADQPRCSVWSSRTSAEHGPIVGARLLNCVVTIHRLMRGIQARPYRARGPMATWPETATHRGFRRETGRPGCISQAQEVTSLAMSWSQGMARGSESRPRKRAGGPAFVSPLTRCQSTIGAEQGSQTWRGLPSGPPSARAGGEMCWVPWSPFSESCVPSSMQAAPAPPIIEKVVREAGTRSGAGMRGLEQTMEIRDAMSCPSSSPYRKGIRPCRVTLRGEQCEGMLRLTERD
jgi:hypothetical protein